MPPPLRTPTTPAAKPAAQSLANSLTHEETHNSFESLRKRADIAAGAGDPLLRDLLQKHGDTQHAIAAFRAAGRTELPALPVARDAKVIAHRALRFEDDGGSFYVAPWMHAQTIPERFLNHPYFQSAVKNGWVEVIPEPAAPSQEVTRG